MIFRWSSNLDHIFYSSLKRGCFQEHLTQPQRDSREVIEGMGSSLSQLCMVGGRGRTVLSWNNRCSCWHKENLPPLEEGEEKRLCSFQSWRFSRHNWTQSLKTRLDLRNGFAVSRRLDWRAPELLSSLNFLWLHDSMGILFTDQNNTDAIHKYEITFVCILSIKVHKDWESILPFSPLKEKIYLIKRELHDWLKTFTKRSFCLFIFHSSEIWEKGLLPVAGLLLASFCCYFS